MRERREFWLFWFQAVAAAGTLVGFYFLWTGLRNSTEANRIATEALQRGQRAYVIEDDVGLAAPLTPLVPIHLNLTFTNVGQTPAIDVRYKAVAFRGASPDPDSGSDPVSSGILGPGKTGSGTPYKPLALDGPSLTRILNEEEPLRIYVTITYKDIFGHTWTTNGCHIYRKFAGNFELCDYGNTME